VVALVATRTRQIDAAQSALRADALAEDKLFATLDPIVRKVCLPNGSECLLSDGRVHQQTAARLVNAFKSTLDEVSDADLILHVVDSASDYYEVQMPWSKRCYPLWAQSTPAH
jgi:GTP-binding protein HflX